MNDVDYSERLKVARINGVSNCIGTALFLAGYIDNDTHVEPRKFDDLFDDRLIRLCGPKKYSLVFLSHADTGFIFHAGIVTQTDPPLVTSRAGMNGKIVEDDSLERFCDIGYYPPAIHGFFELSFVGQNIF